MVADVPKTPWWMVQAQPQDHRGECIGAAQTTQTAVPVTVIRGHQATGGHGRGDESSRTKRGMQL